MAAAAGLLAGGVVLPLARGSGEDPCARAGFVAGAERTDGLFAARIPAACGSAGERICRVGDGTGEIVRETVAAGSRLDCFAFNQFVGAGLNQIPGYLAGECFGWAKLSTPAAAGLRRTAYRRSGARRDEGGHDALGRPVERLPRRGGPRRARHAARRRRRGRLGARARHDRGPRRRPLGRTARGRRGRRAARRVRRRAAARALLTWREGGRTCFEPGQLVDRHTPGRSDELPGVKARGTLHRATLVGALRHDSKSGIGIQLYGIGRFAPYPREIGGSCGDPDDGSGLLLAWETRTASQDAAKAVTVVARIAGPRVRAVSAGGRRLELSVRRRAFLHVVRGVREPAGVPVEVTYTDGSRRRRFP